MGCKKYKYGCSTNANCILKHVSINKKKEYLHIPFFY